jgi:hypothetical protein
MTPSEELRLLSTVLKRIEGGAATTAGGRWLSAVGWLVLVAFFMALFQLAPRLGPVVYVLVGVGCIVGVLTSFLVLYKHSLKQWPALAPFIKVDEVKRRINELKPNTSLERTRDR